MHQSKYSARVVHYWNSEAIAVAIAPSGTALLSDARVQQTRDTNMRNRHSKGGLAVLSACVIALDDAPRSASWGPRK